MVEAMVTLPVFLILLFGLFQLFLVSIAQVQLRYAAFCAARVGAVRNADEGEMKAAVGRILSGPVAIIPSRTGSYRVENLGLVGESAGKAEGVQEEPFRLFKIRVHWDYPLTFPLPVIRPSGILSGGVFGTIRSLPLRASWTAVVFSEPGEIGKREKHAL